jgi:DNA (cytosine-5)-methyltransferase 1
MRPRLIAAVDVFCGAGGLAYGLRTAGIRVVAGIDLDPSCEVPFTANNPGSQFICADVRSITGKDLAKRYPAGALRLLAGCAPCTPFSSHRRGADTSGDDEWTLVGEFTRLVKELRPELVTMENVTRVRSKPVFKRMLRVLAREGYSIDVKPVYCPRFGVPQQRRRLVLLASRIGPVAVPKGTRTPDRFRTVRDAIGSLPRVDPGATGPGDRLHMARGVTKVNLERLKASRPGGTWHDWPVELRSPCHTRASGATFRNVYARMEWDVPAPTITTLAFNFGTGRFGHPEQHRAITLREAAILQGFPRRYRFVRRDEPVYLTTIGRLVGNAVPPPLGRAIGRALLQRARDPVKAGRKMRDSRG